jgi:hypothetical protein
MSEQRTCVSLLEAKVILNQLLLTFAQLVLKE